MKRTADDRCDIATDVGTSSDLSLSKRPQEPINPSDNEKFVDETKLPKKLGHQPSREEAEAIPKNQMRNQPISELCKTVGHPENLR